MKLCVALDVDPEKAYSLAQLLKDYPLIMKVGHRLLLSEGRKIVDFLKDLSFEIFVDLKLHDIPNTVKLTVEEVRDLGAHYLTLHALGGEDMLRTAVSVKGSLKLLGVTLLTSLSEEYLNFLKTSFSSLEEMILYLTETCERCGLDGVVCSAEEVRAIREITDMITVVPGIRMEVPSFDQVRVVTPREAKERGADIIVVGREVYMSEDPREKIEEILKEIG